MGIYRPPVSIDSNPDRALRQQPKKSVIFMVLAVYLPLTALALFLRAMMLLNNYKVMDLTVVDEFVRNLIRAAQNLLYFG